jgi:hypothetical protein
MLRSRPLFRFAGFALLLASLTWWLGYRAQRSDFGPFIAAFSVFFALYSWVVWVELPRRPHWERAYRYLGIGLRVLLLWSIPNFSDDVYRFLWDGRLVLAGQSPFAHPPDYFAENQLFTASLSPELFARLNSPAYFSVYPPLCQWAFALAAWLAPVSVPAGVLVLKLVLLGFECGSIALLRKGSGQPHAAVLYALNPLILLELVGNCHFEGAMIFFLLAGLGALRKGQEARAGLYWALATAAKMLPLLFLPLLWRWLGWRPGIRFLGALGLALLLLFAPLLADWAHIAQSLDLYFRQFQFNASVYYLLRWAGFVRFGFDTGEFIGPGLGLLSFVGTLLLALFAGGRLPGVPNLPGLIDLEGLSGLMVFNLLLYLSLSSTVHPWYVTVPFALSCLGRWRFPWLWSGLVALSYSHYAGGGFQENYALIALEYSILWTFLLWETFKRSKPSHGKF